MRNQDDFGYSKDRVTVISQRTKENVEIHKTLPFAGEKFKCGTMLGSTNNCLPGVAVLATPFAGLTLDQIIRAAAQQTPSLKGHRSSFLLILLGVAAPQPLSRAFEEGKMLMRKILVTFPTDPLNPKGIRAFFHTPNKLLTGERCGFAHCPSSLHPNSIGPLRQ
ncbi:hypothetical protein TNCV_423891 [Trichonephila clavipes]|nr:hypothetical protein TNCV_423891 [Trichonephila clavipes]